MTQIISCDAHDHFEIVCMRRSNISVTTHSEQVFEGIATGIKIINKREFLCIEYNNQQVSVDLKTIKCLRAFNNLKAEDNFFVTW